MGRQLRCVGSAGALGAALTLLACSATREDGSANTTAPYTADDQAPSVCAEFEDAASLIGLPTALAALAADPTSQDAQTSIAEAADKARAIANTAGSDPGAADIASTAALLARELDGFSAQPPTTESLTAVGTTLDSLGAQVQTTCGLPT